ncbi:putative exonuclease, phage-type/RecB [Plasmopara halstedii]
MAEKKQVPSEKVISYFIHSTSLVITNIMPSNMKRGLGRNIMIFASEVPVVSALNPYRKIEDVFLNVWRRTNPRQVSSLQHQLSLALPTPEEKMQTIVQDLGAAPAINELIQEASKATTIHQVAKAQAKVVHSLPSTTPIDIKADVVQFVTSTMNKDFGAKQEIAGIFHYQKQQKQVIQDRNLVFYKKKVDTVGDYKLFVGGKIDGRADGKVIEVKNRVKKFIDPLPKYDLAQLQTYLFILGGQEGELVEHLQAEIAKTKVTKVMRDDKMWHTEIQPYLVRFGSALTYLMKDEDIQREYLTSDAGQQREIIRHFWSQDIQQ